MESSTKPTILVIVGITGDLSSRYLLPAIEQIVKAKAVPEKFRVVGITRRDITAGQVIGQIGSKNSHRYLANHLEMHQMDLTDHSDYLKLDIRLKEIEKEFGAPAQWLFYLSVPPQISQPVVRLLGEAGLSTGETKLLVEKPFGVDLESAQDLIKQTMQYFSEEQIYRIDHYLAKEMSQNFIVFRAGNSLFKRTWNRDFIERIDIIASEKISIEGRVDFYEQTGALKDLVQSHLLQLAALALMETPKERDHSDVPGLRHQALSQLHVPCDKSIDECAARGQYTGYRKEVGNPRSSVETFADISLHSHDPRWEGVPIRIMTGKSLDKKETKIRVVYKKDEEYEANELIIKLQPDEGVEVQLWTKVPGYTQKLKKHSLGLSFEDHYPVLPDAYERVFLDAINSNHSLFASSEEVLETWRIIEPIQKTWAKTPDNLIFYEPGTNIADVK